MFISDSFSLETFYEGRDSGILRGQATYSGSDLYFSTLYLPQTIPNTGGKPNAKLIKGRKINKGLDDGVSGWHHTERDENRS